MRPTKQRIQICKILFDRDKTFHFTINDLRRIIESRLSQKISLATLYNTIHTFKKKGHLKKISINSDKSYFDTNVSNHHHFYDESLNELIDLKDDDVGNIKIKKNITGKKIKICRSFWLKLQIIIKI